MLRLAKVVDRQADDAVTETSEPAAQWTGGTCVAGGTLDLGGETVALGNLSGGGVVSNGTVSCTISVAADGTSAVPTFAAATLAKVRVSVDTSSGEPSVGEEIPVAAIGPGVVCDVSSWTLSPRLAKVSANFVERGGMVVAQMVSKKGVVLLVR